MASEWSFSDQVVLATLVFAILAVLLVLPYFLVTFGFFPDSAFARRVHPSNNDIWAELRLQNRELTTIRKDIEILRKNSDFELDWVETQTDAIIAIGEKLKEKMD
ncbi:hypothetical protein IFR04_006790 [Cadophora malorum]|uniref:Uncharacterized protein n=1 Tax=Cadophora malorum TaxID=108018 RepID=A0A8H7TIE9_9HELO|nr:hypothetical protein IFR04_006790 [Cadophora malorum]